MNIYLIDRTDEVGWDEYDAFVVAAGNEDEALNFNNEFGKRYLVTIKKIGETVEGVAAGTVLGSFNAG